MKLKSWVAVVVTWALLAMPTFGQPVTKIAAGSAHSLFLKSDGSLWAMGSNNYGQLGDGTFNDTNRPEQIIAGGVMAVAAGYFHNLFLKSDGSLWVMGWNNYGQLGDGTFNTTNRPEQIVAGGVTAIAAGGWHSLFLKSDGSLWAMGYNYYGQLGDGTYSRGSSQGIATPEQIVAGGVTAVAAGIDESLFLKSDGSLWAMGDNAYGELGDGTYSTGVATPEQIVAGGVTAIAEGYGLSLFLKSDGSLWGMGDNGLGELGDGTFNNTTRPEEIVTGGVTAIAAGWNHSLFLKSDGSLWVMGLNNYGQLGDGTFNTTNRPEQIVAGDVTAIAAGERHSLFLKSDGSLWAMGWNSYGQLGDGTFNYDTNRPEQIVAPVQSAPMIITQPQSQKPLGGANVAFTVAAIAYPLPNYQWQFNGQKLAGQTAASLSLTNVQFANAGGYSVIVTNAYGSVTSAVAQLTVFTNLVVAETNKPPPPPGKPTIPTDSNHFKVFTNGVFVSGIGLGSNKSTIVLTHGWKDSSSNWPLEMANLIKLELGSNTPNMVAWDWTAAAASPLPAAALDTQGQGYALGVNLTNVLGANYSQRIHFIGHSLGTLVNARAANFIHTNEFSWSNTQMTLFDEAEVAWGMVGNSWATLTSLLENDSSPQQDWKHPLPDQCAWADNYITAFGMPHPQAVNVILTNLAPDLSNIQNLFDFGIGAWTGQFQTEITDYHHYPYIWYGNTVNQINNPNDPPYLMGFVRSWEGGGYAGRPAANTYYIESTICQPGFPSYSGYDPAYNLVQTTPGQANQYLNARPQNLVSQVGVNLVSSSANILANNNNQVQVQLLDGPAVSASSLITGPAYAFATLIKLFTTSLINGNGPIRPRGGSPTNSPAYVWIPVTVPPNALTMAFNFMLQGNGNQDSFQVALNSNNLMTVEMVLIQTNVTMSSGMIDVSQYAGQQVELFFGIVGGTSTNAIVTISDIAFYVPLPPSLQIQLAGTNVVLTWPLSATGYALQSANQLTPLIAWTTVTNEPVVVKFQYTVTNQISGGRRFYRLAETSTVTPALQAQIFGNSFVLSWPASAQNFSLQTTTNLTDANSWATVTNVPALLNQQNVVTNGITDRMRFYRLKMQ
jgi:alpha-tubulin suppressor-like RCC1 family protein/pimeloyl-ACP methyl ester carboxylesterase